MTTTINGKPLKETKLNEDGYPSGKRHPEWKIMKGGISIAAWPNKAENGREYLTYTIQRSWKDDKGEWHNTESLRQSDLPTVALLVASAYLRESEETEEA